MRVLICAALVLAAPPLAAQNAPIHEADSSVVTIHAASAIDGRGHIWRDVLVAVRAGKIVRVDTAAGARGHDATFELGAATLLPGLIDAHVHPGWYINREGALHTCSPRSRRSPTVASRPTRCAPWCAD